MASLQAMPPVVINLTSLNNWGTTWTGTTASNGRTKISSCFDKKQSMDFGKEVIDPPIANALSVMLGDIPIKKPINKYALLPPVPDCIEIGDTRIIGGVRAQNFDIAYRPDGVRIAYDSKTLNSIKSVKKNWQNMINDIATEATTVHTRFPYAIVAFVVVIPKPALNLSQEHDIIRTLERLATRRKVQDENQLAEVISFIIWDPQTGTIDATIPDPTSNLRIEKFSETLSPIYLERYKGLPPHNRI